MRAISLDVGNSGCMRVSLSLPLRSTIAGNETISWFLGCLLLFTLFNFNCTGEAHVGIPSARGDGLAEDCISGIGMTA